MRRTEIPKNLEKPRQPKEIELPANRRKLLRSQQLGINLMLRLVGEPILIPLLRPVLLLKPRQAFSNKKIRQKLDQRIAEISRLQRPKPLRVNRAICPG